MRLSKLQQHILVVTANRIINSLECEQSWLHRDKEFISWRELYYACKDYWTDSHWTTAKASFSRAQRTLMDKGLIGALVLQWRYLEQGHDDEWAWQGQGRKRIAGMINIGFGATMIDKRDVPRYRLICLTEEGWRLARTFAGPDVGKCVHTLRLEEWRRTYTPEDDQEDE
jgi:hypothetical protein